MIKLLHVCCVVRREKSVDIDAEVDCSVGVFIVIDVICVEGFIAFDVSIKEAVLVSSNSSDVTAAVTTEFEYDGLVAVEIDVVSNDISVTVE